RTVISTDSEGAKRLRRSGEIPRMCALRRRFKEFYPKTIPWSAFRAANAEDVIALHNRASCLPRGGGRGHSTRSLGKNSSYPHCGGHILGISPLLLRRFASSSSVEMTIPVYFMGGVEAKRCVVRIGSARW